MAAAVPNKPVSEVKPYLALPLKVTRETLHELVDEKDLHIFMCVMDTYGVHSKTDYDELSDDDKCIFEHEADRVITLHIARERCLLIDPVNGTYDIGKYEDADIKVGKDGVNLFKKNIESEAVIAVCNQLWIHPLVKK